MSEWVEQTRRARELGLAGEFDAAHALLDEVPVDDAELSARVALERGRLLRTAGDAEAAMPHFLRAAAEASAAGLGSLHVDALHMIAIAVPLEQQVAAHERALDAARTSAPEWVAPVLNNLGMTYTELGDWDAALEVFEQALAEREKLGAAEETRIAKWMIAWTLRNLGRRDEALAMQRGLKAELEAAGESDPYVDEEIALLE